MKKIVEFKEQCQNVTSGEFKKQIFSTFCTYKKLYNRNFFSLPFDFTF